MILSKSNLQSRSCEDKGLMMWKRGNGGPAEKQPNKQCKWYLRCGIEKRRVHHTVTLNKHINRQNSTILFDNTWGFIVPGSISTVVNIQDVACNRHDWHSKSSFQELLQSLALLYRLFSQNWNTLSWWKTNVYLTEKNSILKYKTALWTGFKW